MARTEQDNKQWWLNAAARYDRYASAFPAGSEKHTKWKQKAAEARTHALTYKDSHHAAPSISAA